jgi:exosortase
MQRTELAFLLLIGACFAPALVGLAGVWSSVDYYSHGFLVPAVAGWAAYLGRSRRRALARAHDSRGAALVAFALALYFWSLSVGSVSGQGLALVAALAGSVWLLRGLAWLRALGFSIAYLLFMVPVPPEWLLPLIVRLQLFVSENAIALLQAFEVPVARAGNVILLPGGDELFVAEACSGVTSIVTLAPLAVLLAYLTGLSRLRGLLLLACVPPIAMAANLVRVVATVLAARLYGADVVTREPLHTLAGLAVYALGCLVMWVVCRLLTRQRPGAELASPQWG